MAAYIGVILVDVNDLMRTAQSFNSSANEVRNTNQTMMNTVTNMNCQWQGDAGSTYIRKFRQLQDDMDKMYRMIMEHVQDLMAMAQNYIQAEQGALSQINPLSEDVISYP